ncbi:MAG: hypothetical protein H6742_09465 [Alphaproteobacteria bacterium]|nr:hypothetical protein [Alphaproteobacteria bacterium]
MSQPVAAPAHVANPYAGVHQRIRARRPGTAGVLLPVVAAVLATPLARPVLLHFLDGPATPEIVAAGTEAITFRLGALVAAAMAMHTYGDLVRGPDREVLDVHPVQPGLLLSAIAARTARERAYLPVMGAILLSPLVWHGHALAWAGGSAVVLGAWLASLGVGFSVHLSAVWAAHSQGLAVVLDLLRGDNPRMQAALIYAPGVALAVVGVAVGLASGGLSAGLQGWAPGWAFLALPPVLGLVAGMAAPRLANAWYVRASAMLAEIDAAWAGVEEGDEERRVYLEWVAGSTRPELLRALRQGWRRLRSWAMGAWGLGLVGLFAGWSADPSAPADLVAVAGGAVALLSVLPTRLALGDPPWLDRALGVRAGPVAVARASVSVLYAQGSILPPVAALLVRQGLRCVAPFLMVELLAVILSVVASLLAARLRGRAAWVQAPLAVVAWAALASLARLLLLSP